MNCPNCKIELTGQKDTCPLCGMPTRGKEVLPPRFPSVPLRVNYTWRFVQLLMFVTLAGGLLCVGINREITGELTWSLFVLLGIASFWVFFAAINQGRKNVVKLLMWQMVVISVLALVWDYFTGFYRWSLDFVLPILSAVMLAALAIFAKITKLSASDYMVFLILCALMGFGTVVLLYFDIIRIKIPALIAGGLSALSILAIIIFEGRAMLAELKRRLHL